MPRLNFSDIMYISLCFGPKRPKIKYYYSQNSFVFVTLIFIGSYMFFMKYNSTCQLLKEATENNPKKVFSPLNFSRFSIICHTLELGSFSCSFV